MSSHLQLLKTRRFLPLFITQFLGAFNDNAFKNALLIWVTFDNANTSGLDAEFIVTLAAGLFILPFFLFSATAGQLADKYDKAWIAQKTKQVEIVLMISCAFAFYYQSLYALLVILFLIGAQSTFFGPVKYSLLPEHLQEKELLSGNGLIEAGTFLSILLGTIFGGIVIATTHGVACLTAAVITIAVAGWFSSRAIPPSAISDDRLNIGWNIAAETWKIVNYARKEHTVFLSIIGISWFWLLGVSFLTQFPSYTKAVIHGSEHVVTLFLATFSIGIGVGSILCNKLLKGEINGRLVPLGSIGMTAAIILFTIASYCYAKQYDANTSATLGAVAFLSTSIYSWIIVLSLLLIAGFGGLYIVPLYAIMQHRTCKVYISRTIAANNIINALFMVGASVFAIACLAVGLSINELLLIIGLANIPVFFIVRHVVKSNAQNV